MDEIRIEFVFKYHAAKSQKDFAVKVSVLERLVSHEEAMVMFLNDKLTKEITWENSQSGQEIEGKPFAVNAYRQCEAETVEIEAPACVKSLLKESQ